jgi:acetyl-CoA carboxylase biotin carboxyl carrier protein
MHLPWEEIEKLTKYLEDKGLAEVSIETKDGKISLKKGGQHFLPQVALPPASQKTSSEAEIKKSNLPEITSPMVGTFYASPTPGAEPFVKVGSKIKPGDVLCIIEAMKIMNELPSEISGTVKEILVKDGQTVEYGQVVIRVEP